MQNDLDFVTSYNEAWAWAKLLLDDVGGLDAVFEDYFQKVEQLRIDQIETRESILNIMADPELFKKLKEYTLKNQNLASASRQESAEDKEDSSDFNQQDANEDDQYLPEEDAELKRALDMSLASFFDECKAKVSNGTTNDFNIPANSKLSADLKIEANDNQLIQNYEEEKMTHLIINHPDVKTNIEDETDQVQGGEIKEAATATNTKSPQDTESALASSLENLTFKSTSDLTKEDVRKLRLKYLSERERADEASLNAAFSESTPISSVDGANVKLMYPASKN
ncbi:MAG: hypothetical protein SFT91_02225 [Rickettsiaceae bacterium]|nr:hypothetical protein [Rickettsiaceae bacterium]